MSDEKKIVIKAEQEKDTAQENTNPALLMKTPAMPLKMEFAEKITKEPEVKIKRQIPDWTELRDTILILKNQQAASTTAISWKSEHPRTDILNKFV